jgi:hypothetical protein
MTARLQSTRWDSTTYVRSAHTSTPGYGKWIAADRDPDVCRTDSALSGS